MKKRIVAMFLAVCFIVTLLPTAAFAANDTMETTGSCGVSASWKLVQNGESTYALKISGEGAMKDYTDDDAAPWSTESANITKIEIANGITHIGDRAFMKTAATNFEIPKSVTSIGDYAFAGASELKEIAIPATVTNFGVGVFQQASALEKVTLPDNIREIPNRFVNRCSKLTSIEIPDSVETIEQYAFYQSGLTSISLGVGSKLKKIEASAFNGCSSLTKADFSKTQLETIGTTAFKSCALLNDVALPESITTIENQAFADTALTKIDISVNGNFTLNGTPYLNDEIKDVSIGSINGTVELNNAIEITSIQNVQLFGNIKINASGLFKGASCTQYDLSGVKELTLGVNNPFYQWRVNKTPTVYVASDAIREIINNGNTGTMIFAVTNGGTFADSTVFTNGTLAEPEKLGARFVGWYTKDGTDDDWGDMATTYEKGKTYYAKYAPKVKSSITVVGVVSEDEEVTGSLPDAYEEDTITLTNTFDGIPEGKIVSSWEVVEPETLTIENNSFKMPSQNVKLRAILVDKPVDEPTETVSGGTDGAAAAAVILGGAAIGAVTYAVGTQIWMETHLPDGVIPTSREQLALMLWNAAGKPQPAEAALYADVSAEAADTQLAARWCVEQGLMKDYGENFKPGRYVFRWQVIKAWNQAQKLK